MGDVPGRGLVSRIAATVLTVTAFLPATATAALTFPKLLEPQPGASPSAPRAAVTIPPPISAAAYSGQWQVLPYKAPGVSVHATVIRDGRVLIAEGSGNDPTRFAAGTFDIWIWDPSSGTFTLTPQLPFDLFCGGHALLADGKVLFIGGTSAYQTETRSFLGTRTTYEFDPASGTFSRAPDMANARWYASALEQGDGSVLAVSGLNDTDGSVVGNTERFDPATTSWTALRDPSYFPTYPSLTLLENGQVFYSGSAAGASAERSPGVWDPSSNAFTPAPAPSDPTHRDQAASILLPPAQAQRIAVFGGGTSTTTSYSAVAYTDIYNLSNPSAPTRSIGWPMTAPKMHVLGVILPDETVFETSGGLSMAANPVQEAAIYHPDSGTWSQMNPPGVPRTYHSEAVLLPDGRVATLGSSSSGYAPETRIEVFSPPYLFSGQRPEIRSAPAEARYGSIFEVTVGLAWGAALKKLVLIKPASVTHSIDPNQRLVELPFAGVAGVYAATVPSNPNLTPPGWYMLFALDVQGRPSVARWVHVS